MLRSEVSDVDDESSREERKSCTRNEMRVMYELGFKLGDFLRNPWHGLWICNYILLAFVLDLKWISMNLYLDCCFMFCCVHPVYRFSLVFK